MLCTARDHFLCPLWMIKRDMDPEMREIEGDFSPSVRNVSDSDPVERFHRVIFCHISLVQQEYFGKNFRRNF